MKPQEKNGKIIFESKLGCIERYFQKDPRPKYIFYDTMHGGKARSDWKLNGLRNYIKQVRKFYKEEVKRNRSSIDGLKMCKKATDEINRLEREINLIEKRHKKHTDEFYKNKNLKKKRQKEWEQMMLNKKKNKV